MFACFFPYETGRIALKHVHEEEIFKWIIQVSLLDIVINLLLYIPVGFLLMRVFRKTYCMVRSMGIVIMLGLGISIWIEFVQYFLIDRHSSSFDVVLNTLSTVIGVALAFIFEKLVSDRKLFNQKKYSVATNRSNPS
jgi:glycopeptide antibiotics resistance protein